MWLAAQKLQRIFQNTDCTLFGLQLQASSVGTGRHLPEKGSKILEAGGASSHSELLVLRPTPSASQTFLRARWSCETFAFSQVWALWALWAPLFRCLKPGLTRALTETDSCRSKDRDANSAKPASSPGARPDSCGFRRRPTKRSPTQGTGKIWQRNSLLEL